MIKKIAIIISVLVFSLLAYQASSGSSINKDLREEVSQLKSEVAELKRRITRLEARLDGTTINKKVGGYGHSN